MTPGHGMSLQSFTFCQDLHLPRDGVPPSGSQENQAGTQQPVSSKTPEAHRAPLRRLPTQPCSAWRAWRFSQGSSARLWGEGDLELRVGGDLWGHMLWGPEIQVLTTRESSIAFVN